MSRFAEKLEQTVLDLGAELYRLRADLMSVRHNQDKFVKVVSGLRAILDEKGIIAAEDFESVIDIAELAGSMQAVPHMDQHLEEFKKSSH